MNSWCFCLHILLLSVLSRFLSFDQNLFIFCCYLQLMLCSWRCTINTLLIKPNDQRCCKKNSWFRQMVTHMSGVWPMVIKHKNPRPQAVLDCLLITTAWLLSHCSSVKRDGPTCQAKIPQVLLTKTTLSRMSKIAWFSYFIHTEIKLSIKASRWELLSTAKLLYIWDAFEQTLLLQCTGKAMKQKRRTASDLDNNRFGTGLSSTIHS